MVVEVDRQAQARSLPVKLASLRFGKVIVWLPGSGPRIFRGFSRVRPARGNQTDFCARPADGLVLLAERVGHHQQHSGAIQSESDQRSSSSLCSSSNIDMALGSRKTVAARSNETPCSEGQLLKVVLELESLVDGHEDVNASAHRRNQDLIFVAGPSQVSDRFHRILRESSSQTRSQPRMDTLDGYTRRSGPDALCNQVLGQLKILLNHLPRDGRVASQEIIDREATFEIVEQKMDRNTRSAKTGSAMH